MSGELLLAWMSETGDGSIRDLRARAEWLGQTRGRSLTRKAFGLWMRDLSALGHAEVDWIGGRWSVASPAVVRLPCGDGVAVLAGARRPGLVDALAGTDVYVAQMADEDDGCALRLPAPVFIQFDSPAELRDAAAASGVAYAGCFARRGAAALRSIAMGDLTAPPAAHNDTLERRIGPRPNDWAKHSAMALEFPDGLYSFEANGRREHRTVRGGSWYRIALAEGTFLELARTRTSCLSWRPEEGSGRGEVGTVFVDFGAPLPALQARVLTLCSGLPPRVSEKAENLAYRNVPRAVARAVAASLLQEIEEATHGYA
ncbi:hypothetical protein FHX52_3252 [Humibacillus xanthopallidus]|uniref:Uncharacterized protein n=1 Tax=Humibacillus xanthopallidus TaxID=412689 RepID=A0A543PR33_9MICO|nr:hypothetical protein [Humibacillus xanthopallidus]TQN46527.1 hypothetical protein FHX52_3252 [Humibacillus xanthopallidus]